MPRLYVIAGPKDSGNRLMATAFIAAGCVGEASNVQSPLADLLAGGNDSVLINHGLDEDTIVAASAAGYEIRVVVVTRDWFCVARGEVWRGHIAGGTWRDAMRGHIPEVVSSVFAAIARHGLRYVMVPYESLCVRYEQVCRWVCDFFDVQLPAAFARPELNQHAMSGTWNANDKWYDGDGALYIVGFDGLGDNIYQRPFVRAACERCGEVWLRTSWPQLYWDIILDHGLKLVRSPTALRTQKDNADRFAGEFVEEPIAARRVFLRYNLPDFRSGKSILRTFEGAIPLNDGALDMRFPIRQEWTDAARDILLASGIQVGRFALLFPPTVRTEWRNEARNSHPDAMRRAAEYLRTAGYQMIRIGWLADGLEWYDGDPPEADVCWDDGRLNVQLIAALMQMAAVNVTSVKFALPLGIAVGAKTLCLMGGCYPTELLLDQRLDLSRTCMVAPEPFCGCLRHFHDCNKVIGRERIEGALKELAGTN